MKQRFVVTLLAVAIASLSASAFAVAPVINDFRSPVIADDTPATNSNNFVYPDAINLDTQATDPDGTVTSTQIKWSFFEAGTPIYRLNNRQSLNLGTDDPNAPASAPGGNKEVSAPPAGTDDPRSADSNPRTVTFRNFALSPLPEPGSGTYPDDANNKGNVGPQILTAYTKTITMFASDGQRASSKTLLVYTENKGVDHLSGIAPIIGTTVVPGPGNGWTTANLAGATFSSSAANGVCIQVGLDTGVGFGSWLSGFGALTLVQNNVYRIRINVESTAPLAAGTTPLWDFVIDNVRANPDGSLITGSQGKYSVDVLNWDTNGSANSVGLASGGRRSFDIWYAPLAVSAADWNSASGEFAAANDAFNDGRFLFRILDVPGVIDAQNDAGTLCLKSYRIDRIDIDDMTAAATVYNNALPVGEVKNFTPGPPPANAGFQNAGSNMTVSFINISGATTVTNGASGITVEPAVDGVGTTPPNPPTTPGSWNLEIVDLDVGDDNVNFSSSATLSDNWPITWNSNELLKITAGGQAPDATGQSNPPDVIRILMDAPTSEIGMDSLITAGANILGFPKTASVTTYTAFYYTQNQTAATAAGFRALRPRVSLLNVPAILSGGQNVNNGGFRLTFLKVERMNSVD